MSAHVLHGDSLDVLARFPANTFDAIVTDPPCGIGFMGKEWDSNRGGRVSWVAWLESIMRECLRVLKPGGHAFVWALPRTSHWTATAIEQAGFDVRERIAHLFGSGMPHAKDLSKAIDEMLLRPQLGDAWESARPVVGTYRVGGNAGMTTAEKGGTFGVGVGTAPAVELKRTTGATSQAQNYDGWATNLKPGCEDWWLARKPPVGTLAANALAYGVGGLNIDATRVPRNWDERGEAWKGSGVSAKPDAEKIAAPPGQGMILHPGGGWPANIVLSHAMTCTEGACAAECPVGQIDDANPQTKSDGGSRGASGTHGIYGSRGAQNVKPGFGDPGGVSRYFNVFYAPKAPRKEREAGLAEAGIPVRSGGEATGRVDGSKGLQNPHAGAGRGGGVRNDHPTVKALELMRWLVKMITPPGGLVLDPFCGSGSTGVACALEGAEFLGIEQDAHNVALAKARIDYWARKASS